MSMTKCGYCDKMYNSMYTNHPSACASEISRRQMRALESIAASLEKIANPPIDTEHLNERNN